jgi:ankyrin repeat protein
MNPLSGVNVLHAAARGYGEYEPLQNYPRDVVNAPNLDGETPLITAVKERNFKASLGISTFKIAKVTPCFTTLFTLELLTVSR